MKRLSLMRVVVVLVISVASVMANNKCNYQQFSINSTKGTKIAEYVEQLSNSCKFSIIVADDETEKIMNKELNRINIKDMILYEILAILLGEHDLSYSLKNSVLRVSYIQTKTYHVDYIISERTGSSSTSVQLSSSTNSESSTAAASSAEAKSGMNIDSLDKFNFWANLKDELQSILNRPEDSYKASAPVINKEAGLVTVSATAKQLSRLESYLQKLNSKLQNQVLIDVQILSVNLNDTQTTGIDWSQIYALQSFQLGTQSILQNGVSGFSVADNVVSITDLDKEVNAEKTVSRGSLLSVSGSASIKEIIKFLKEQGDVQSMSNPKVLTLSNQPALISVGSQYFYKITSTGTETSSGGSSTTLTNDTIDSVFAGILLDITPEISNNNQITLKINPSISEVIGDVGSSGTRSSPPDLTRKQLSSVITVSNGNRVILGGLISTSESKAESKVPLLGDIPILGYIFKHTKDVKTVSELVIIITPTIIRKSKPLSIKDLGYGNIDITRGDRRSITANKNKINR